jgi:hypothetical protein
MLLVVFFLGNPKPGQGLEVNFSLPTGTSVLRQAQNKFRLVGQSRGRNEKIFLCNVNYVLNLPNQSIAEWNGNLAVTKVLQS